MFAIRQILVEIERPKVWIDSFLFYFSVLLLYCLILHVSEKKNKSSLTVDEVSDERERQTGQNHQKVSKSQID
jgi:hypothetical protein